MELTLSQLPASSDRLQQYTIKQRCDNVVCKVIRYCHNGWPDKHQIEAEVRPYWNVRADLTLGNNPQLLLYGKRIVVPKALQKETLEKIHAGHQGIVRCQLRAAESVWWPGISQHIKDMIHQCPECLKEATNNKEPLITTPLPKRPWQRVASDLFYYDGKNYLIVIDYFSRYPEVVQLTSTTSANIIKVLKMIFACHGVPEEFISDNGPQYASQEFAEFSKEYSFIHKTSSPHYAQSNGLAERMVRTAKDLLKKSSDFYRVLLEYRNTPLSWCKLTPTQLLMGRKARTLLPTMDECLIPQWPDLNDFKKKDSEFKRQQKCHYDRRHRTSPLPILPDETKVWISTGNKQVPGRVLFQTDRPQSYIVQSPEQGKYIPKKSLSFKEKTPGQFRHRAAK
jgi:transposase InsO family protein